MWGPALSPWLACPVGAACRGGGGGPSPGGLACHCCEGRQVSGAVHPPVARPLGRAPGVPRPVCPGCGLGGAWGPSTGPTACALAGWRCALLGWPKGVPGGGCPSPLGGASEVRCSPSPGCPSSGRAVRVHYPRALGAGVRVWGPSTVPVACMPCGGCVPWGCWGAVPGGGVARHRCEGRLVSGAVPPPAARPLGRAAGVPRPVCPECGWCGRGDRAPAPQFAPLRAGVARCGAGGSASPVGVPFAVVRGV